MCLKVVFSSIIQNYLKFLMMVGVFLLFIMQGTVGSILDRKDETKTQTVVCQQLGK